MVIDLKLSLNQGDYNFGSRLAGLLEEIVTQTIPPSKRRLTVKQNIRLAHQDESKDDIDQPKADEPQDYQLQADAPADREELAKES